MNAPRPEGLLVIGKDVRRTDAIPKVTGAAQYVADIQMPGMLHGAVFAARIPTRVSCPSTPAPQAPCPASRPC